MQGYSLLSLPLWDRTAPTPMSEASTSMMKGISGFGKIRVGAKVKFEFVKGQQNPAVFPLVRADKGADAELKFRMNLHKKTGKAEETLFFFN